MARYSPFVPKVLLNTNQPQLLLKIFPEITHLAIMPHSSSNEEPLGIAGARFLQGGCSSYHQTDNVKTRSLSLLFCHFLDEPGLAGVY